jgi:hypothetical protein
MLTVLQEKLAEAHGLAIAAAVVTDKVEERVAARDLRLLLGTMRLEANETRARCLEVEHLVGGEAAEEVLAHANTVSEKASDLAVAWFKSGTGPLEAWSFLAMGEAGEVATWRALDSLARRDGDSRLVALAEWALPVQERHLADALAGTVTLAEAFRPGDPRWG